MKQNSLTKANDIKTDKAENRGKLKKLSIIEV
jgi:hypothetical protein